MTSFLSFNDDNSDISRQLRFKIWQKITENDSKSADIEKINNNAVSDTIFN